MDGGSRKSVASRELRAASRELRTASRAVLLLVTLGTALPARAQSGPVLTVRVDNQAAIDGATITHALTVAARIFRRAAIPIQFAADRLDDPALTIVVIPATSSTALRPADDSMGVAPSAADGTRGNVAYVFADRVVRFAENGRLDPAVVFGCAIAHELGHLLLPVNAHTRDGIMRGNWDTSFLPRTTAGVPGFPPEQARLLQLRVAARLSGR